MMAALLTVRPGHGDIESCPYAYGTGRGRLGNTSASSATERRFFVPAAIVSMAAGIGTPYGVPVPWFRSSTPDVSRHPIVVEGDRDGFQPNQESEMSTSPKGTTPEIRPVRYVSRETVIRRIRRYHARHGYTFHIASTKAEFEACGDWHIRDRNSDVAFRRIAVFESYARSCKCLKPDEVMVGQTMYRMFDDKGQLIGVQDSRFRAEKVVKAINGSMVEFTVTEPEEEAEDRQESNDEGL